MDLVVHSQFEVAGNKSVQNWYHELLALLRLKFLLRNWKRYKSTGSDEVPSK
jgi:hypothetical protein